MTASTAGRLVGALRAYTTHPDPLVSAANVIALLVASNQPFYPLYVYWLVSNRFEPTLLTFLSTPFFLAVPALARLSTVAGRALLPLAGIANTILCAKLLGVASAVELFLIPCVVLALLLFRPKERLIAFVIAGAAFLAFMALHGHHRVPLAFYSVAEYEAFARLNALSATMLTACVALMFSNLLASAERSAAEAARR